jgi:hypothetical protein
VEFTGVVVPCSTFKLSIQCLFKVLIQGFQHMSVFIYDMTLSVAYSVVWNVRLINEK